MTEQPTVPAPAPAAQPEPTAEEKKAALEALCKTAAGYIDAFLLNVGIKDPAAITDEAGWRYIQLGSASGRAAVLIEDQSGFLHAEARIMTMPSDKDLVLPLMRELLEMNLSIVGPVRLGIREDIVFGGIQYPVEGLDEALVGRLIHSVMSMADGIDDTLGKKYGGTSIPRQAQP